MNYLLNLHLSFPKALILLFIIVLELTPSLARADAPPVVTEETSNQGIKLTQFNDGSTIQEDESSGKSVIQLSDGVTISSSQERGFLEFYIIQDNGDGTKYYVNFIQGDRFIGYNTDFRSAAVFEKTPFHDSPILWKLTPVEDATPEELAMNQ
jgi:hypothetical protein